MIYYSIQKVYVPMSSVFKVGGVHPKFFEKLDFELAMGPLGYPSEPTLLYFFEVPDLLVPTWPDRSRSHAFFFIR